MILKNDFTDMYQFNSSKFNEKVGKKRKSEVFRKRMNISFPKFPELKYFFQYGNYH